MSSFAASVSPGDALHCCEKEIVGSLQKADLGVLSREGVEIGVIPQDVKKAFDSLDCNVSSSLKIRFILMHGYEGLQKDSRLYERWLDLLAKHGVSRALLDSNVAGFYNADVSYQATRYAEGIGDMLSGGGAGGVVRSSW